MKKVLSLKVILILSAILLLSGLMSGCEPPQVTIGNLTVSPEETAVNEAVTVSADILSSEESDIFYSASFSVNDAKIESKEIKVSPGETTTVSFSYSPASLGTYTVDINGQTGTFKVVDSAEFTTGEATIAPDTTITEGKEVTVSIPVKNNGDLPGTYTSTLIVDEEEISSQEITIIGNSTETVTATYVFDSSGTHHMEFGGASFDITVLKAATFETTFMSVGPLSIYDWESATVKATITNTGDLEGTFPVEMKINGTVKRTDTLTLAPEESHDYIYTIRPETSGINTITILGESKTITVKDLQVYSNETYYFKVSYPVEFNLTEVDPTTAIMEASTGLDGAMSVKVDRIPLDQTLQEYYDSLVAEQQAEQPDWAATEITNLQSGTVVGYKFNFTGTIDGKKWSGIGRVYKNGGYGYFITYSSYSDQWSKRVTLAKKCLDSFTWPVIYNNTLKSTDLGLEMTIPGNWNIIETGDPSTPLEITVGYGEREISGRLDIDDSSSISDQEYIHDFFTYFRDNSYSNVDEREFNFSDGSIGYQCSATVLTSNGEIKIRIIAIKVQNTLYSFTFESQRSAVEAWDNAINQLVQSLKIS